MMMPAPVVGSAISPPMARLPERLTVSVAKGKAPGQRGSSSLETRQRATPPAALPSMTIAAAVQLLMACQGGSYRTRAALEPDQAGRARREQGEQGEAGSGSRRSAGRQQP